MPTHWGVPTPQPTLGPLSGHLLIDQRLETTLALIRSMEARLDDRFAEVRVDLIERAAFTDAKVRLSEEAQRYELAILENHSLACFMQAIEMSTKHQIELLLTMRVARDQVWLDFWRGCSRWLASLWASARRRLHC